MRTALRRDLIALAAVLAASLVACSSDRITAPDTIDTPADSTPANPDRFVTVMTRNVYLGASLDPVIAAPSPQLIPLRVADVWAAVVQTDFPQRAKALADEIAAARPDLIGLQEVSLWRTQFPGDAHLPNGTPAAEVAYDFLAILMAELQSRGLHYVVASSVDNFEAELFMFTGAPGASPTRDVRLTDRDVILAKNEVTTWNPRGARFTTNASLTVGGAGGPPVVIARGWTSVDAKLNGLAVRFFNTHLEVDSPPFDPIQIAQGNEVLALLDASPFPVIAVGDYNSPADGSTTPTYGTLRTAGFVDVWPELHPALNGFTAGMTNDLLGPVSLFNSRIDLILFRGPMSARTIEVVGASESNRLVSGMMPSDHAGVVATIRVAAGR